MSYSKLCLLCFQILFLNSTWGYPSTACYHRFIGTMPLLSPELRTVISDKSDFPAQRLATACFIRSRLSTFRQSYHWILLGAPSKPVPSSKNLTACNGMWTFITTNLTNPRTPHFNGKMPLGKSKRLDPYIQEFVSIFIHSHHEYPTPGIWVTPSTSGQVSCGLIRLRLLSADFTELLTVR